jgi:hypothetical protein
MSCFTAVVTNVCHILEHSSAQYIYEPETYHLHLQARKSAAQETSVLAGIHLPPLFTFVLNMRISDFLVFVLESNLGQGSSVMVVV